MSNNYPEDGADEDYLANSNSSVSTLECDAAPAAPSNKRTGPCCEKCQATLASAAVTICRKCVWYASLGTFVELDPNWETTPDDEAPAAKAQPASGLQMWLNLVPRWGWVIIASVFVVVIESVLVRLLTSAEGSVRTAWSLTQLAIGAMTVTGCHVFNFLSLAADDADVGLLDLFLKPFRLWTRTCRQLPKRLWFFDALVCGLTAVVMSFLVIGGIPYDRLWNWGIKEPPKQNLMGAVMDRAKEIDSNSDSLEDAIGDFAGKGGVEEDGAAKKPETPQPPRREKTDCVILGYQLDRDGRLTSLLLGAAHGKKLAFAGRVTPKLSEAEISELVAALKTIVVKQPFISIAAEDVIWVRPKFTCRVTYSEKLKSGHLRDIQWDTILQTMSTR